MRAPRHNSGFSLIEVIIAGGIFSVAVATILALLPSSTKQAAGSRDLQTAARLPDAVRVALTQLVPASTYPTSFKDFADKPRNLTAARDGTAVRELDLDKTREQYFLIEVLPFKAVPLEYDPAVPLLALNIRVSWPYQPMGPSGALLPAPAGSVSEFAARHDQFTFNVSLRP